MNVMALTVCWGVIFLSNDVVEIVSVSMVRTMIVLLFRRIARAHVKTMNGEEGERCGWNDFT